MKISIEKAGRFLTVMTVSIGLATAISFIHHKNYWNGTIRRVQNVDFNILSHSIPTKLSLALQQRNTEEIQRTLNSNYGLFGLVITDCKRIQRECPEQKILYATEAEYQWKKLLDQEGIKFLTPSNSYYDLLRDPPPLLAESEFDNPHDETWEQTGKKNEGAIIGRIYYVRGVAPDFWPTYLNWFKKLPVSLFVDSGAQKYYSLTLIAFLLPGLFIFIRWENLQTEHRNKDQQLNHLKTTLERQEQSRFQAEQDLRQLQHEYELITEKAASEDEITEVIITSLERQIAAHRSDIQQRIGDKQKTKEEIQSLKSKEKRSASTINVLSFKNKELERINKGLQKRILDLEAAAQKDKEETITKVITNNNELTAYYLDEIRSKDQEIENLKAQIKDLIAQSHLYSNPFRIGIVGGHPDLQMRLITYLEDAGLHPQPVFICSESKHDNPPSGDQIRERLERCDFTVILPFHVGHDITDSVNKLEKKGNIKLLHRYPGHDRAKIPELVFQDLMRHPEVFQELHHG